MFVMSSVSIFILNFLGDSEARAQHSSFCKTKLEHTIHSLIILYSH